MKLGFLYFLYWYHSISCVVSDGFRFIDFQCLDFEIFDVFEADPPEVEWIQSNDTLGMANLKCISMVMQ